MRPGRNQDGTPLVDDPAADQPDDHIGDRMRALRDDAGNDPGKRRHPWPGQELSEDETESPSGERREIGGKEMDAAEEEPEPSHKWRERLHRNL